MTDESVRDGAEPAQDGPEHRPAKAGAAAVAVGPTVEDNFARNLKALRQGAGMSQDDLAEALAERGFTFHQATIYKLENGTRRIQLGEAIALADILEVSVTALTAETQGHLVALAEFRRALADAKVAHEAARSAIWTFEIARDHLRGLVDPEPIDEQEMDDEACRSEADFKRAFGMITVDERMEADSLSGTYFNEVDTREDPWALVNVGLDEVKRSWSRVVKATRQYNRSTWRILGIEGEPIECEDRELLLEFTYHRQAAKFLEAKRDEVLERALSDVFGGDWGVRCVYTHEDADEPPF